METFQRWFVLAANVFVFVSLAYLAYTLKWAGPEFCFGVVTGAAIMAIVYRLKLGRWL